MKNLFLLGFIVALADPMLLYVLYTQVGIEAVLGVVVLSPLLGPRFVAWARRRAQTSASPDMLGLTGSLGDELLFTASMFLFFYPGPLTTLAALLLLVPAVRRMLQAWAFRRLTRAVTGGSVSMMSNMGGVVFTSAQGIPPVTGFPEATAGGLKRTEGRIVDGPTSHSDPALPAPESPDPEKK
ncbi:MAG TPA: FxsA family protein [Planctomycetota bacterium]|nr:FxsA family protein [Planctomycetota bacterium]